MKSFLFITAFYITYDESLADTLKVFNICLLALPNCCFHFVNLMIQRGLVAPVLEQCPKKIQEKIKCSIVFLNNDKLKSLTFQGFF